eukprot:292797_1
MSTNEVSTKWMNLVSPPGYGISTIRASTGMNQNNYIVIDYSWLLNKIKCVYKYDIDIDKWNSIDGIDNIANMTSFSAALDVKKQILFLFRRRYLTQIDINKVDTSDITHHTHNIPTNFASSSRNIIVNNSLFVFPYDNGTKSIWKWNTESKTFTKFSDMYNKKTFSVFTVIYNHNNNCLLLFGGYDYDNSVTVDYILEFNINAKQWHKLPVSL